MKRIDFAWMFLIIIFGALSSYFTSWWAAGFISTCVISFIKPIKGSFWKGFLSFFLFWGILSFYIHYSTKGILSDKMARLLPLGGRGEALVLLTSILGGLGGGLSSLTGASISRFLRN